MTLRQIKDAIEAEVLAGEDQLARDIRVALACDLMSDVLAFGPTGALLLTGLTNVQVVRTAEMAELAGVCFVRGKEPERETLGLARASGLPVLRTRLSLFETCGRLGARGVVGVGRCECGSGRVETGRGAAPVAEGDE